MICKAEPSGNPADNIINITYPDGVVSMDRRVYEQKLGTLIGCNSVKEAYEVAVSSTKYIKELYHTEKITNPIIW